MNILSYRETDAKGHYFELMIDGQPISDLINTSNTAAITCWHIANDLPNLPVYYDDYAPDIRVVGTANCCHEIGCGHASCRVVIADDTVIWQDFFSGGSASRERRNKEGHFVFSRDNYNMVMRSLIRWAADQRRNYESPYLKSE